MYVPFWNVANKLVHLTNVLASKKKQNEWWDVRISVEGGKSYFCEDLRVSVPKEESVQSREGSSVEEKRSISTKTGANCISVENAEIDGVDERE